MTELMKARTLTVSIACPPEAVYDYVADLRNFPVWVTSFCRSIREERGEWILETPEGPMKIRFAERNAYGVLDHIVTSTEGTEARVPMRVVPNGTGSEILITSFQLPGMSDEQFLRDAGMVEQDLQTLKRTLES
ncbi:SRPBCC family protein [Cohnella zeiphila]|uniref:SRPBCC family protein n=1 Tax=Cohnella zeiphila TaxID=2761120 RepID=A0A7X0SSS8_9BACL|nr:SRPBCC family protein [Cohnella zeiphila]MBB6733218.1 SRPBCC family protein [Cohnella zeiphila]